MRYRVRKEGTELTQLPHERKATQKNKIMPRMKADNSTYFELPSGHTPMTSMPDKLTEVLKFRRNYGMQWSLHDPFAHTSCSLA